ncbi:MAG: hypothetical protein F6J97_03425 [Leptolyngbya sp. SIO4C1]|nr:hypothetical protein [Leptolyngbya sp. SIO4C1]
MQQQVGKPPAKIPRGQALKLAPYYSLGVTTGQFVTIPDGLSQLFEPAAALGRLQLTPLFPDLSHLLAQLGQ